MAESASIWLQAFKRALYLTFGFVVSCFAYGYFNDFAFWHAYAPAGRNSAIAHALYYGIFAGPIILGSATVILRFFFLSRFQNNPHEHQDAE